jgi:hypothetical protein
MFKMGFEPAQSDPCLFIHKEHQLMVVNCHDDQIWFSPDNQQNDEHVKKLQELKCDSVLEEEGDMFDFLRINFAKDRDKIVLTQTGPTDETISCTGMDKATEQHTLAACDPSGSDKDGAPFDETWNHRSAVGMLLHVCSDTCPDLQFAVHQACRFAHSPKKSHGQAVKRIICCLVKTREKGLEFVSNLEEGLDNGVDADFAKLLCQMDDQDPASEVKNRIHTDTAWLPHSVVQQVADRPDSQVHNS